MLGVVMMRLRAARGATNPTRCAFELAPPRLCWTIDSHPQNLVHPIRREPLLASFHCAAGRVFRRYLLYSHTSAGFYNSPAKSLRPRLTKNSSRCILSPPEPAEIAKGTSSSAPRSLFSRNIHTIISHRAATEHGAFANNLRPEPREALKISQEPAFGGIS